MTDIVIPSVDRPVSAAGSAVANRFGGESFIMPRQTRLFELPEAGLETGPLNGFRLLSSSDTRGDSSTADFSVEIDEGEAIVGGRYAARDNVSSPSFNFESFNSVTVALRVPFDQTDTVDFVRQRDVRRRDRSVPLFEVADDSDLTVTDVRPIGRTVTDTQIVSDISVGGTASQDFTTAARIDETVSWGRAFLNPPVVQTSLLNQSGPDGTVFATLRDVSPLNARVRILNQNPDPLTLDLHVTARGRAAPEVDN